MNPKQNPFTPLRSTAGFTLVEILVVIVIIASLAAVTFVGVRSVRQSAHQARCADNLRTWGVAINSYASDNNGLVTWNGWANISNTARYYETYLGGDGVSASATMDGKRVLSAQLHRRCPGQKWDGVGNGPMGYAMPRPNPKVANINTYNIRTARDPSQLLLLIDAEGFINLNGPDDLVSAITPICNDTLPRHKKTVNALFGDGHVANYRLGDIAGSDNGKKEMRERWFTLR